MRLFLKEKEKERDDNLCACHSERHVVPRGNPAEAANTFLLKSNKIYMVKNLCGKLFYY